MSNLSLALPGHNDSERGPESNMENAAPGWYYDPEDQAVYRYWDGSGWTDECSDVFPSTTSVALDNQ